ncbi:S1 family peptidase [Mycolicibacterium aichiense]|uniref:S1 family peptidase n=1 Tax=Mycolicibacterium aichiense TaxID=1799 RepID=UPI003D67A259
MALDTGIDNRHLYSAVRIRAKYQFSQDLPAKNIYGTGFLVGCEGSDEKACIVSNRHILDFGWVEPIWADVEKSFDLEIWLDRTTKLECKIVPDRVFVHYDDTIDVAAIPFSRVLMKKPIIGDLYPKSALPWSFLADAQAQWELLEPSENVYFPGYPHWYDRNEGRPIMRTGAIVSDPQFDYRRFTGEPKKSDGNRQILFEAFSSGGNSGSPVFVEQRGLKSSNHIAYTGVYHPSLLVGINAGHIELKGETIETAEGKLHLTNWHVGLSRMFKTSAIIDVVRDLSANYEW